MGKNYYIILLSFVCLAINSCAEIDGSFESAKSSLSEKMGSPAYDILSQTMLRDSENLFSTEQTLTEDGENSNPKNKNIFLLKQSPSGSREWIIDLGISDQESGISATFDSTENIYLTRYKRNRLEDNEDSRDFTVLLTKYNSSGGRDWIKNLGKSKVEYGARLTVDSSDNIYVTGFSNEFVPLNTLLAKYDASGNRVWTKKLGSTLTDFTWDITVDSSDNIYLTGIADNIFAQNISWHDDILLMKFNSDGIKL